MLHLLQTAPQTVTGIATAGAATVQGAWRITRLFK